jgi:hypothetical protein
MVHVNNIITVTLLLILVLIIIPFLIIFFTLVLPGELDGREIRYLFTGGMRGNNNLGIGSSWTTPGGPRAEACQTRPLP